MLLADRGPDADWIGELALPPSADFANVVSLCCFASIQLHSLEHRHEPPPPPISPTNGGRCRRARRCSPRVRGGLSQPAGALVCGFAPAGGNDIIARLIGQWLTERLGQTFVVE